MKNRFSTQLDKISPSGIREFFDLVISQKDVISLGVGEPDFSTPKVICNSAIDALEKGQTSYTSNKGLLSLREEISYYLNKKFQSSYDASSEILITNGVSEGVDLALRAILNPGDEVILPEPNYVCYNPLIQLTGASVVSMDTTKTNFIPDPKQLKNLITKKTKALILCSPNNPTGTVIDKHTLKQIADIALQHDLWIICDEIYSELVYDEPFTSFSSLPNVKDHCILLSGFSKSFAMTGWRLGYLCGPESLVSRALKIHQYSALCAPILAQLAGIDALTNAKEELLYMKKSFEKRRNFITKRFNELGYALEKPKGAFYCFPDIRSSGLSSHEFALQLLKKEKVAVVPGTAFGPLGEGYIRCCFATDLNDLVEAMNRIEHFSATL
jgi:aminotransferase